MKIQLWIRIVTLPGLVLMLFHCNKRSLPEFYYQCAVDGELYIPNSCANCNTCRIINDTILMIGANRGFESVRIGINDSAAIGEKQYVLNGVIGRQAVYDNSTEVSDIFTTTRGHTGVLSISHLDKKDKIVEGSFYFQAYNSLNDKVVQVTLGRFRLKYSDY